MVRTTRQHIWLGSPIPIVSGKDFVEEAIPDKMYHDMWSVVGPTIEKNYNKAPLERLFVIAFMEGIRMTTKLIADKPELVGASSVSSDESKIPTQPQPSKPRKLSI